MSAFFDSLQQEAKDEILVKLRQRIRKGVRWEGKIIEEMAEKYLLPAEEMYEFGQRIYTRFDDEFDAVHGSPLKKVEAFLSDRFQFRRNAITKRVMYRPIGTDDIYEPCQFNNIWRLLQHNLKDFGSSKAKVPIGDVQNLLESNYVEEYNPIKEYFQRRKNWDGIDHITNLASHIHTTDQKFWEEQFKKCLVRMIACSVDLIENRIVMVLVQPDQNKGKSNLIRFLCPPELKEYYKEDPVATNKDSEISLTENFMWNMEELEALDRKEINSLKSFISRNVSKQRRAYARQEETRPRIVNFWGSTNKDQFLTDIQNTRWLCFRVNHIDWNYNNSETGVKNVDINKVWDQAWHLYTSGFNYRLDTEEAQKRDSMNHSFESMGNEKQLIIKHLMKCPANSVSGEFNMVIDSAQYLEASTQYKVKVLSYNVQIALAQLGFISETRAINGTPVKGFWLTKKPLMNGHTLPMSPASEPVIDDNDLPF
jgi:predicted P-loop ATPase